MRWTMGVLIGLCVAGCGDKENSDDTGSTPVDDTGGDTGDTDTDTDETGCTTATFIEDNGAETDLTEILTTGEYTTLADPGTLEVCPGTWFARLIIRADIAVIGLGDDRSEVVLSGGESGTILDIGGPREVSVSNLTLDRGAGLDVEHNSGGGGIYCEEGASVTVEEVVFSNGFANDGAGMYTRECEVAIQDVDFVDNLSEDDGGALTLWDSTATLSGVTFENNTALDGGAIAMFGSTAVIEDSVIVDNVATYFAGGIWQYDSTLTLRDVTISGNLNTGDYAGGLMAFGTTTLERVVFSENTASGDGAAGGGLYVYFESEVTGTDCDFSDNGPDDIWVDDYSAEGGVSMDAGSGYSFGCASNTCWEE